MAKNEFLPFGIAAHANVLSNAEYQALPARNAGFQSGVAKSKELNSTWRQSSVMSAVLGQFIADNSGKDVLDNGDLPKLQNDFSTALVQAGREYFTGVIGQSRNAAMSVGTVSAIAPFSADELIVATALGGRQYRVGNVNRNINLSINGAGGMDTGTAPTSGFVAIYVIYNPVTDNSELLATNATTVKATEVYSGSNMPTGYTASALVSIWPVSNGQFKLGFQKERWVYIPNTSVLSTSSTTTSSPVGFNFATVTPLNTRRIVGTLQLHSNAGSSNVISLGIACTPLMLGSQGALLGGTSSAGMDLVNNYTMTLVSPQTMYYTFTSSLAASVNITVCGYYF